MCCVQENKFKGGNIDRLTVKGEKMILHAKVIF